METEIPVCQSFVNKYFSSLLSPETVSRWACLDGFCSRRRNNLLKEICWHRKVSIKELTLFPMAVSQVVSDIQLYSLCDRLDGQVVMASASRAEDPGFESCLRWDFSWWSPTSDSKNGTPVANLPGTWHYRVSTGTGQPGVSTLWLGEVESLICNLCLSAAARTIVWADPSLRYTSLLLGR